MADHAGHRQRMLARLSSRTLCDHEYLEMLLFYAIPRRNTNDIAHRLLARFGDMNGVLNATEEELRNIEGIGESAAAFFILLGIVCEKYRPYSVADGDIPKRYERESFLSFVKHKYSNLALPYECLDAYLMDDNATFYACRRFSGREIGKVTIASDAVGELLSRDMPSGVVLVHNHPSGSPAPSKADDETTKCFQTLCRLHNVLLCDHLIYARAGIYSYYQTDRLGETARESAEKGARK